jgi:hypothetical protein
MPFDGAEPARSSTLPADEQLQIIAAGADIAADVGTVGVQLSAASAGNSNAASNAMIAMTTSSSTSVKPRFCKVKIRHRITFNWTPTVGMGFKNFRGKLNPRQGMK